jgi:hypothetical protein
METHGEITSKGKTFLNNSSLEMLPAELSSSKAEETCDGN